MTAMRFVTTSLSGVMLIELDAIEDDRGSFARTFCAAEFARAGIVLQPKQANISHNVEARTLRGLHYQADPHGESKVVHCVRGRIFDVAVDLRRASPTYRQWYGVELSPELRRMLFIPEGCAHGFLTLEASSDVSYLMGQSFVPEAARGVRWNDPAFAIDWPAEPRRISSRDASYPDFAP
jgi:dTDP-4-dehydrorhamnose 3,5-epimerase